MRAAGYFGRLTPAEGVLTMSTAKAMTGSPYRKTHREQRRPPFDCIALLLQGGGALGAYQAGVYRGAGGGRI